MKLERKHALALLAVAVWNVLTYAQFTKALINTDEDRPTGYYVAHSVLIVVNILIAAVLGRWGWQALKASRAADVEPHPGQSGAVTGQPADHETQ